MKYPLILIAFALVLASCNGKNGAAEVTDEATATTEKPAPNGAVPNSTPTVVEEGEEAPPLTMEQAELQNRLRGYSGNIPSVAPIPAEDIKDLMPQKLAGLFLYENEGETNAALGAPTTFVVTIYRENYNIIKVSVTDTGGSTTTLMASAPWANQTLNKKNDRGFDRTTTYKRYPAHEQYNLEAKVGVFEYIIDSRYVISMQGKNNSIELMRQAADELNLDQLKALGAKRKG